MSLLLEADEEAEIRSAARRWRHTPSLRVLKPPSHALHVYLKMAVLRVSLVGPVHQAA